MANSGGGAGVGFTGWFRAGEWSSTGNLENLPRVRYDQDCEDVGMETDMSITLTAERPPLTEDETGSIRIAGTRVPLELVVSAFNRGLTAEQIVGRFETLQLADVFAVLG